MRTQFHLSEMQKEINLTGELDYYLNKVGQGCSFLVAANGGTQVYNNSRKRLIAACKTWKDAAKTCKGWSREGAFVMHVGPNSVCTMIMGGGYEHRDEIKRNLLESMKSGVVPAPADEIKALSDEVNPPPAAVYLAGPINGCTDEECKDWRAEAKKVLPNTVDPMVRDYRGREDECFKEIVEGDKTDIQKCGAILVNYAKPSVGTSMEIFFAHSLRIPIFVVAAPGTTISPWLRYHSTAIVNSFREAFDLCLKTPSKQNRWHA